MSKEYGIGVVGWVFVWEDREFSFDVIREEGVVGV